MIRDQPTFIIAAFLFLLCFHSCRKPGCLDLEASNYNRKADIDDNSCIYPKRSLYGTYILKDSIHGGMALDTYYRRYRIEISKNPNEHFITWKYLGFEGGSVISITKGDTFLFSEQHWKNEREEELAAWLVAGKAYLSGEKLHFELEYFTNDFNGDFYLVRGSGRKE